MYDIFHNDKVKFALAFEQVREVLAFRFGSHRSADFVSFFQELADGMPTSPSVDM